MAELAVTAVGRDRPGIVSAVAAVLHAHGGNLEDSAMTILGGQFAMMLLVEIDDDPTELTTALRAATAELGLDLHVVAVEPSVANPHPTHVLTVYGGDKPGLVAGVSATLAEHDANIVDLCTRVLVPDSATPIYAMFFELAITDEDAVVAALDTICTELGVDHTLRTLTAETY